MGTVIMRVDKLLEERGMNVLQFSKLAGLNYRTALSICHNSYERIGMTTLAKICDALKVEPKDIFLYRE